MWAISGQPIPTEHFNPFRPADVLYDFDGPRIFTVIDSEGELNLACWSDEDRQGCRYLVVPTTTAILNSLRIGGMSVHDALNQPHCWLCEVTHQGELTQCLLVGFDQIPRDALPAAGVLLSPTTKN